MRSMPNTPRCSTPTGSTRWELLLPSGRSATATTAMAESVMGIIKTELHRNPATLAANGGPWKGLDDLEVATCQWVSWFNEERLHSELDDRTPAEVEAEHRHQSQPDAA